MRLSLSLVIASLFGMMTVAANALTSPQPLTPTQPYFYDLNGASLESVAEGDQVMIATTFRNNYDEVSAFLGIIEVRNVDGITEYLAWQSGTVKPLGNKTISVSWVVQNSSAYQSRAFAITDLDNPQVLSRLDVFDIDVTKS